MSFNETSIQSQFNLNGDKVNRFQVYGFEGFRLDAAKLMLYRDDEAVALAPKVVETLVALVERPGEIVGKDELMNRLWTNSFVEEANLTQNIYLLRKTLGKTADGRELIETFRRRGYRFNGQIQEIIDNRGLNDNGINQTDVSFRGKNLKGDVSRVFDSVAVLPLKNESADPQAEYLSDGVTESIINRLSQLSGLRVVARNTVFRYKNQDISPQEIGRELGVGAVLTGRVLQLGERLIIRAELVETVDGWQLWGEQYDRPATDIIELQEAIAQDISKNLHLKLSGEEEKRLVKRYTESPEAYHLYLKGRYFLNQRLTETVEQAARYFQQAVDVDTAYAPAYVGLADCYPLLSLYGTLTPHEAYPKAKAAAMKALEIDSGFAKAYNSLGVVKLFYEWDWTGAEIAFKQAIKLTRGYPDAHQRYGMLLTATGRFTEAAAEFERAQELDPLSLITKTISGYPFYYARDYAQAAARFQAVIVLDEDYSMAHFRLGLTLAQQGDYEKAIAELQKSNALSNDRDTVAALGYAQGLVGNRQEAEAALAELATRERNGFVSAYDQTLVYLGLGNPEAALGWLEKAYAERSYWLIYLKVDPALDSLRENARFIRLVNKMFGSATSANVYEDSLSPKTHFDSLIADNPASLPKSKISSVQQPNPNNIKYLSGLAALAASIVITLFFAQPFFKRSSPAFSKNESVNPANLNVARQTPVFSADLVATAPAKLYAETSESEQLTLIKDRARQIQILIEDNPVDLNDAAIRLIKTEIDRYNVRTNSLSQKHFEEGLRTVYGRATQFAPIIARAYRARGVPPAIGIYQAMIESEYHDCLTSETGTVGLFQFTPQTAQKYGLLPKDYCSVETQSDAAAHYLFDLLSDFDNQKTLALFGFNAGESRVRDHLRELRKSGVTERTFWAIFNQESRLSDSLPTEDESFRYMARFFAAAIIGENPQTFALATPPLSSLLEK